MKTCIGGAFYNKYVKAAYKNDEMLVKVQTASLFDDNEDKRALILNKMSDFITEDDLKQFFQTKFICSVQKVKVNIDKPLIIFGPDFLEKGSIKACFKLGLKNRASRYRKLQEKEYEESMQFRSSIMSNDKNKNANVIYSYQEKQEMLDSEEIKRPVYLYELRFETLNKDSNVDFEINSINNFTYETDKEMMPHVTYACQDYYDKSGRFLCRNSTKLP